MEEDYRDMLLLVERARAAQRSLFRLSEITRDITGIHFTYGISPDQMIFTLLELSALTGITDQAAILVNEIPQLRAIHRMTNPTEVCRANQVWIRWNEELDLPSRAQAAFDELANVINVEVERLHTVVRDNM